VCGKSEHACYLLPIIVVDRDTFLTRVMIGIRTALVNTYSCWAVCELVFSFEVKIRKGVSSLKILLVYG